MSIITNTKNSLSSQGSLTLPNGWLIVALRPSFRRVDFFVSKDGGEKWSFLCFFDRPNPVYGDVILRARDNVVYAHWENFLLGFDATDVSGALPLTPLRIFEKVHGYGGSDMHIDGNMFHLVFTANLTSDGFYSELIYRKFDLSNITTDLTVKNYGGGSRSSPKFVLIGNERKIAVRSNNYVVIVDADNSESTDLTFLTSGVTVSDILVLNTRQKNVVYILYAHYISGLYLMKSTNGITWSQAKKIMDTPSSADLKNIDFDPRGNVHLAYRSSAKSFVTHSKDNGESWETPREYGSFDIAVLSNKQLTHPYFGYIHENITDVSFEKVLINAPPLMPNGLNRPNFDAKDPATFAWRFNDLDVGDYQTAFSIQVLDSNAIVVDTGKMMSADNNHLLPAGVLTNGKQYQWRVKVWDKDDVESPWSAYAAFTTSAKPVFSITSPTVNQVVDKNTLLVQWQYSNQQSAYRVVARRDGSIEYDSGKVSNINARSHLMNFGFHNNSTYTVEVILWSAFDVESVPASRTFSVVYTPPAKPILQAYTERTGIRMAVVNPTRAGAQPVVVGNEIYKLVNHDWIRISKTGDAKDFAVGSEERVQYKARAIGDNGTYSESDAVEIVGARLSGVWLYDVNSPDDTVHQFKFDGGGRSESFQAEHVYRQFAGRSRPAIQYGAFAEYAVSVKLELLKRDRDRSVLEKFARSLSTLLYRDGRGRKFYTSMPTLQMDDIWYGNSITLNLQEIDHEEGV